ncbi:hypothetical protein N0V88_001568 [Collariella sp. IMI 366227]|nr:hypothetical protein N0V88_001568 [Collariella sp. IMI 366227]
MPSDREGAIKHKRDDSLPEWSGALLYARRALFWLASALSPWQHRHSSSQPEKLRPTAYLDGLRGFAAFLVYWHHHELWAHKPHQVRAMESSFGFNGEHYFLNIPGIGVLFHGGHFAVATFFVISGYVLSAKPISLIHAGDQAKLADNLGSALFRRWLRLYLPVISTTFIYMTILQALRLEVDNVHLKPTYLEALGHWFRDLKNFSFIFQNCGVGFPSYNFHLWSIPVEFKGSIVVYTSLLAFARCTRNARLWLQAGLVFYFLYVVDAYNCALFTAGMLLSELEQLSAHDDLPAFFDRFRPHKTAIFYSMFAVAMYLGGAPAVSANVEDMRKNPGWYYLSFLKPRVMSDVKWFFLFFAAAFLVASTPHIRWLKRFFETRFCQYLGRVSYSLYLVHGPVLWTLGDRLYAAVGFLKSSHDSFPHWINIFPLPWVGPLGMEVAFLVPHLILFPVTFYCAEVVTKAFDEPSVRFPQWLYKAVTARKAKLPA